MIPNKHSWNFFIIIIMKRKRRRDSLKVLKLTFAQLFKYTHKKLQFITAAYTAQFVAMWLGKFGCWFGEPVTFGLSHEVLLCYMCQNVTKNASGEP